MREEFGIFLDSLRRTTRAVEPHYFQMPVAGLEEPIYRERVYCYELYHQLRNSLPRGFPFVLAGEVDKEGHPTIHKAIGPYKPDFIVHEPGGMGSNLVVVEVKPSVTTGSEFREDLRHLRSFLEAAGYFAALSLVYGGMKEKRLQSFARDFETLFAGLVDKQSVLMHHDRPGEPARVIHAIP